MRSFSLILSCFVLFFSSCKEDVKPGAGVSAGPNVPGIKVEDRLPQLIVTAPNGINDEPKTKALLTISENNSISFQGDIGIEIRGASSQMFPKKSYGFETWDANNEDLDVSLLGYPAESDWILYGPYSDKSLLRNFLIYDLARETGSYASRCRFVELAINSSYKGVYVFMEKLKRDKNRIDLNKLNPEEISGIDLTGGYILKIDKIAGSNAGSGYNSVNSFASEQPPLNGNPENPIRFLYEYPDAKEIRPEQKNYISSYIRDFEKALASENFSDPQSGYAAYIDVPSFIDFFIMNELSHNVDGYRLSTYLHKDKGGKLKAGPIWDFNLAFGNADYCGGSRTDTWAYRFNQTCPGDFWQVPFWWERLLQDPAFVRQLKNRWTTLRAGTLSESAMASKMDTYVNILEKSGAVDSNFKAWNILGKYVWPNAFIGSTFRSETSYLQDWIQKRGRWMDSAIGAL